MYSSTFLKQHASLGAAYLRDQDAFIYLPLSLLHEECCLFGV
jgi:hypothetical protein